MPEVDVNYLSVFLGLVISMVLGFIWYAPAVFGNAWMQELGKKKREPSSPNLGYLLMALSSALLTYVMYHFIIYVGADTIVEGAQTAFWLWLGFTATTGVAKTVFQGHSFKLFAIDYGYTLVQYLVIGMLIVALN